MQLVQIGEETPQLCFTFRTAPLASSAKVCELGRAGLGTASDPARCNPAGPNTPEKLRTTLGSSKGVEIVNRAMLTPH